MDEACWTIATADKDRFDAVFKTLDPEADDTITGKKARQVLMKSKLPTATLGRIWELADMDTDGKLNSTEFSVAMFLVQKVREGEELPAALPEVLKTSAAGGHSTMVTVNTTSQVPGLAQSTQTAPVPAPQTPSAQHWVVSAAHKAKYDAIFEDADKNRDGLVSGASLTVAGLL